MTLLDRLTANQPPNVRAVLELAYQARELGDAYPLIVDTFCPGQADVMREIAAELIWAEDLRADEPAVVLRRLLGYQATFLHPDRMADEWADMKETQAVSLARGVARQLGRGLAA